MIVKNKTKKNSGLKRIFYLIWQEFIYGGHLLSLGAVSIVFTSAILLKIEVTWDCLLVVYLGMHSAYLYNRYKEFHKDYLTNPERTKYIKRVINRIPFIITSFSVLLVLILVLYSKLTVLFFGLFLFAVSLLYSKVFKNVTQKIIGFKNIFVSLMWASLPFFLFFYYSFQVNISLLIIAAFVFLRLFINTNSFDVKDIESDKEEKLLTPAVILGEKELIRYLYILNIFSVLPIIIGVYFNLLPFYSIIIIAVCFYAIYFLKKLEKIGMNEGFLYNVIIDGELILWSVFIFLGKAIL